MYSQVLSLTAQLSQGDNIPPNRTRHPDLATQGDLPKGTDIQTETSGDTGQSWGRVEEEGGRSDRGVSVPWWKPAR